jgi:biopolymer transport protein ExbD
MAFSAGNSSEPCSEINVTPLIDVLLVLLIIFMVMVPLMPRGLDSALPQDKSKPAETQPALIEVRAGARPGEVVYRVNRREVAREALGPALQSIFEAQPERRVIVEADRRLNYEPVAWAAGEAKRSGASAMMLQGAGDRE